MDFRAILFHKQATSARLRFLLFSYGSVCALEKLPVPAQVHETCSGSPRLHPASVLQQIACSIGLSAEKLRAEPAYRVEVEVAGALIQIVLIAIDSIDPPFEHAEQIGARFIDLTQARGLPPVELELLRRAYESVLGG
ncbi:MAG: hypothetical protein R3E46_17640 [Sedimenticolaceae bacterium]